MTPLKRVLIGITFLSAWAQSLHSSSFTPSYEQQKIQKIIIEGSHFFPNSTIKSKLPYKKGDLFSLTDSNLAIENLYSLGLFEQIKIKVKPVDNGINLYIDLTEKPLLEKVIVTGNKNLGYKELAKKIPFADIKAVNDKELEQYARTIQEHYKEKGYHFVKVKVTTEKTDTTVTPTFHVTEGVKSIVKKVRFKGNNVFTGKELRKLLLTKEDWILGPLDHSGSYHPLALEQDKINLENFYKNNGYLYARVPDARISFSENKKDITVTFTIHEGEKFTIDSVKAPGNDILTEKQLLHLVSLRKGLPYSQEQVRLTLERLKTVWGDHGYIHATVEPSIEPDHKSKTIALVFHSHLGEKQYLRRINIHGNEKTRDKVIRRQFLLDEGDALTTTRLEASKNRIAGLGYFDQKSGVNYTLTRVDDTHADIDLQVQEVKTGSFHYQMNYGGSPNSLSSSSSGLVGELKLTERNMFGRGIFGHTRLELGQGQKGIDFGLTEPWLFDKPIRVGLEGNYNRSSYSELKKVQNTIQEEKGSFSSHIGFVSRTLNYTSFDFRAGVDKIEYYSRSYDGKKNVIPQAEINGSDTVQEEYQKILNNRFQSGTISYLELLMGKDTRNHHTHISRGSKWTFKAKCGIPTIDDTFGFYHFQFDGHWYTPLLNETDIVLHVHGHFGHVDAFSGHSVPFRELYHIGGQASVRGWDFGQIGPQWYHPDLLDDGGWQGESIGAKNAAFVNVELVFPFTQDMSVKGVVFYDGGSGWKTPDSVTIPSEHLRNNSFDYRHSIGFGVRLLQPQPMRIDWGFKLDRRTGENSSQVSFASYYDF